jgi:hypothetical protein
LQRAKGKPEGAASVKGELPEAVKFQLSCAESVTFGLNWVEQGALVISESGRLRTKV